MVVLAVTATWLLASRDWRWSVLALALQYAAVFALTALHWPVELALDGKRVNRCDGPPYLLGTEESSSDTVIPPGKHTLTVRAQDGDGWLEQTFAINGAP